ncbi:MAG: hypothetical protein JRG86_03965 [Deltaproteobacteria bacterium]|jgi:hypothetical protein|nr:hypothetical protein [Deltaproteobacteria bacterium]
MRKILIALIAVALATPVFAQEEPPPIVEASHNAVVNFLKLTEDQVVAWDEMYWDHRDAEEPIKEEIADVQEQLEALFELEDPDPVEVGNLTIARRNLGEDLLDVHLAYHEAFVALLDEGQVRRLRFIARADDVQKFIPAFKLFELIPRR